MDIYISPGFSVLSPWGRVVHVFIWVIIGLDNALPPVRHQAIILTNADIMSIASLETYLNKILFKIQKFSFQEMYLKMLSAKCQAFCLGLNVSTNWQQEMHNTNAYLTHLGLALFFWSYKINSKICDT